MDSKRERPPFSTISGTSVRLNERDTIAIYRWDDLSWVAHFRDGYGELERCGDLVQCPTQVCCGRAEPAPSPRSRRSRCSRRK